MATRAQTSKGVVLALTCAAQFMVVLDIAIVNVALPSIQQDLGIEQSTLQWIVIAYGLMLGGFLLLGGRMADLLGRRRMLLTGLTLFSSASLLAGVAGSAELLISARALQGFGAALLPTAAISILAVTFAEGAERNRALGIFGAVAGVSASVGVIASGLFTDGPGWRWVFFINVPIGILLIAMAATFLPVDARDRRRSERFDVAGAVTVTGGLLLFVYALNRGADFGWGSGSTLGLFAASVVMLSAFVRIEARSRSPLVPGSSLRNRTLVAANLSAFFHDLIGIPVGLRLRRPHTEGVVADEPPTGISSCPPAAPVRTPSSQTRAQPILPAQRRPIRSLYLPIEYQDVTWM